MKNFNVHTTGRVAIPRSERLREYGKSSPGSNQENVISVSEHVTENHSHVNKFALDAISIDNDFYLWLTQKVEGADDSVTRKVMAGYADRAGVADSLSAIVKLWGNDFDGSADVNAALTFGVNTGQPKDDTECHLEVVQIGTQKFLHSTLPFYSDSDVSAFGPNGTSGGGGGTGGKIQNVYTVNDFGRTGLSPNSEIDTFNAYAIDSLNTRLGMAEGNITSIQNALTSYVPTTRKINNKALSSDVTLAITDIGRGSSLSGGGFLKWNNSNSAWELDTSAYITGITSSMVTTALGYTPFNSANFTQANIQTALGISNWALTSSKPSYKITEIGTGDLTTNGFLKRNGNSWQIDTNSYALVSALDDYTPTADFGKLTVYGGMVINPTDTQKILEYEPSSAKSLYICGDVERTLDAPVPAVNVAISTGSSYNSIIITHQKQGPSTTEETTVTNAAGDGKVISSITVNRYGHVSAIAQRPLTASDIPDLSATYLPLAGGTMTGDIWFSDKYSGICFGVSPQTYYGYIAYLDAGRGQEYIDISYNDGEASVQVGYDGVRFASSNALVRSDGTNTHTVWDADNAYIGSGLRSITIGDRSITNIITSADNVAWGKISSKPSTISGYGITDAKIENGVITLGSNTITPLTASALDGYVKYLISAGGAAGKYVSDVTKDGSSLSVSFTDFPTSLAGYGIQDSIPIIDTQDNGTSAAGTWKAKTTPASLITAYTDGMMIRYKLTYAGASTTTLNVNGLGAKTIYRRGTSKLTTQYGVGSYLILYYSTSFDSGSWQVLTDYDANTTYSIISDSELQTGTATTGRAISAARLAANYYISNGTVHIAGNSITPLTADSNLSWDKLNVPTNVANLAQVTVPTTGAKNRYVYDATNRIWTFDNADYLTTSAASSTYQPLNGILTSLSNITSQSPGMIAVDSNGNISTVTTSSIAHFGTAGDDDDYVPISLNGTSMNVLTRHQDLSAYLQKSALNIIDAGTGEYISGLSWDSSSAALSVLRGSLSGYLTTSAASSTYQPLDADLTAIAGLSGTSGLLKKTAANTWSLDTNTYLTTTSASNTYLPLTGGTLTGPLHVKATKNNATTGSDGYIDFTDGDSTSYGRIGQATSGLLGIYASGNIVLRPNDTAGTLSTSYGVSISPTSLTYNGEDIIKEKRLAFNETKTGYFKVTFNNGSYNWFTWLNVKYGYSNTTSGSYSCSTTTFDVRGFHPTGKSGWQYLSAYGTSGNANCDVIYGYDSQHVPWFAIELDAVPFPSILISTCAGRFGLEDVSVEFVTSLTGTTQGTSHAYSLLNYGATGYLPRRTHNYTNGNLFTTELTITGSTTRFINIKVEGRRNVADTHPILTLVHCYWNGANFSIYSAENLGFPLESITIGRMAETNYFFVWIAGGSNRTYYVTISEVSYLYQRNLVTGSSDAALPEDAATTLTITPKDVFLRVDSSGNVEDILTIRTETSGNPALWLTRGSASDSYIDYGIRNLSGVFTIQSRFSGVQPTAVEIYRNNSTSELRIYGQTSSTDDTALATLALIRGTKNDDSTDWKLRNTGTQLGIYTSTSGTESPLYFFGAGTFYPATTATISLGAVNSPWNKIYGVDASITGTLTTDSISASSGLFANSLSIGSSSAPATVTAYATTYLNGNVVFYPNYYIEFYGSTGNGKISGDSTGVVQIPKLGVSTRFAVGTASTAATSIDFYGPVTVTGTIAANDDITIAYNKKIRFAKPSSGYVDLYCDSNGVLHSTGSITSDYDISAFTAAGASGGSTTFIKAEVVPSVPQSPDPNTLYLIPE